MPTMINAPPRNNIQFAGSCKMNTPANVEHRVDNEPNEDTLNTDMWLVA